MGASSSSERGPSPAQQEEESTAASTGSLPVLRAAFTNLSHPNNSIPLTSLQDALSLNPTTLSSESTPIPNPFTQLLPHIGVSIVSQFFPTADAGASWVDFLRGYNRCCARAAASSSIDTLFRLYSAACGSAGIPCELEFDANAGDDGKIGGRFKPSDLLMLLWVCWIMEQRSRVLKVSKGGGREGGKEAVVLPDVAHLVLSALVNCGEVGDDGEVWDCDVFGVDRSVSAQKVKMWVLATAPGLAHCFSQYVQESIKACAASARDVDSISSTGASSSSKDMHGIYLLTCGRAWSISQTLRNAVSEELVGACFPGFYTETPKNLLYRSSIHGKGLSRFWSNVEGYHGSLLILISASSADASEGGNSARKWVIGVLTEQGLGNRDAFYGASGYLYAISPIFRVLPPSGKDKNFVYCHLRPTASYQANPKPVGLAFGGAAGNERIFIDGDFSRVTIRHHAVDKTYQPGSLIPNQGFLPVEASVMEAEVWGFGGKSAKDHQDMYKRRETLFSEQRRKVDMKTFGSWDESPEKMMMDMVSDPNGVQREDR